MTLSDVYRDEHNNPVIPIIQTGCISLNFIQLLLRRIAMLRRVMQNKCHCISLIKKLSHCNSKKIYMIRILSNCHDKKNYENLI